MLKVKNDDFPEKNHKFYLLKNCYLKEFWKYNPKLSKYDNYFVIDIMI